MKTKILFLYTEIAEYFLAGVEELSRQNTEVHIVRWPINKEAPFSFRNLQNVFFYEREKHDKISLLNLAKNISPDIIVVSGWVDKAYLYISSYFKKKIPVVLTLDNHWTGSLRQHLAILISPFRLKTKFSHAWVPGKAQKKYALKLGFKKDKIYSGFYSADTKLFMQINKKNREKKKDSFPKKLLYVGRYIEQKGIFLLWEAFSEIQKELPNNWELICVGTGELFEKRIKHPKIKHLGFVQPKDMGDIIAETGVFVLPSNFEPWGVVVHEYAAAGFPMVCSNKVGAATTFLKEGENGFFFKSNNKESLKSALNKIMNSDNHSLIKMGNISHEKSKKLSPEKWAKTVISILNSNI